MRRLSFSGLLFLCFTCTAQVIITPQLPRVGMFQKQQLWAMLLTNTSQGQVSGHVEVQLSDVQTGQPVLLGRSKSFAMSPGNMQVNASLMDPIIYMQLGGNQVIDLGPAGLLPVGNYMVCITFFQHEHDAVINIAEECDFIEVEPLGPPQLFLPWNEAQETNTTPTFYWIPPSPPGMFTNLRYDIDIVEILPGQALGDAIQQNIPLLHQSQLLQNSLLYPNAAPTLQPGKQYAWRVTATDNGQPVSRSDTWSFSFVDEAAIPRIQTNDLPFIKLSKGGLPGYSVQVNYLKFEYTNSVNDSTWNVRLFDLSQVPFEPLSLQLDSIPIRYGQNMVNIDLRNDQRFINQHVYLLEVKNAANQIWRMRFEFRRKEDENN